MEIFDREAVVRNLSTCCFGAEGTSAALVCAHKVGKTTILEHLEEKHSQAETVVTCKVSLDLLRGSLEEDQSLSDSAFLRFFLQRLDQRLLERIHQREAKEEAWALEVAELAGESHSLRQSRRQLLARCLEELSTLRRVRERIAQLVTSDSPQRTTLLRILNELQGIGWRIVLIIDDFQDMLRETGFSDRLFSFLRGANNEKKIVSLVASTTGLMENSLHAASANKERKTIFNQFLHSQIEPFDEGKAKGYIRWLEDRDQKDGGEVTRVDDSEIRYLYEIVGGSPFFLGKARAEFVGAERPATVEERVQFEKRKLGPAFHPVFETLWSRCSEAARGVLLEIAGGRVPPSTGALEQLEREGFVRVVEDRPNLFARLFTDFAIAKRPPGKAVDRLKILFLAANPLDETRLALADESAAIEDVIEDSALRDRIEVKSRMETRPAAVLKLLIREKPQIVHFSGHGGGGELMLVDEQGLATPLTSLQIETLFGAAGGSIRVAVFNACYSETQARAISRHVDCAIGMKEAISDAAAQSFSELFYRAIGDGESVEVAFIRGRAQIAIDTPGEEANLVLLPRWGVHPSEVFLLSVP